MPFVPEVVGFPFHAVEKCFGRYGPVDFIGVLEEHAYDGLRGFAIVGAYVVGLQEGEQAVGAKGEFCAEELAELFRCAVFVDGDAYGVLVL